MPPRWLSAGIVAWWLAMMGWLFWHDLWPSWRPGEPPQFYIDLVEEVRPHSEAVHTYWNGQCQKKDEPKPRDTFRAKTRTDYQPEDDTFTFHTDLDAKRGALKLFNFKVVSMNSEYRVNRAGQLRSLRFVVNFSFQDPPAVERIPLIHKDDLKASSVELWGEVRDDQFFAHCRAAASLAEKHVEMDLPPVRVSHNASVLLPLHPVNRIHGLRLGQSWRQPLVDPVRDAFGALGAGVHHINARVLPQPQILKGDGEPDITCLVIEYEDEGQVVGRTWVEQDSERVQQQEAILDGDHWTMRRDNPRRAIRRPQPGPPPDQQPRD